MQKIIILTLAILALIATSVANAGMLKNIFTGAKNVPEVEPPKAVKYRYASGFDSLIVFEFDTKDGSGHCIVAETDHHTLSSSCVPKK